MPKNNPVLFLLPKSWKTKLGPMQMYQTVVWHHTDVINHFELEVQNGFIYFGIKPVRCCWCL